MMPLGPPSREIVFRVRVVRDVRAKLCACLLVAGACGGPVSSCSCSSSGPWVVARLSRLVVPLSRGQSVLFLNQNGSVGGPVGCSVVVPCPPPPAPPGLDSASACLVVVCLGLSPGCLLVVSWLSASVVSCLFRGCLLVASWLSECVCACVSVCACVGLCVCARVCGFVYVFVCMCCVRMSVFIVRCLAVCDLCVACVVSVFVFVL